MGQNMYSSTLEDSTKSHEGTQFSSKHQNSNANQICKDKEQIAQNAMPLSELSSNRSGTSQDTS